LQANKEIFECKIESLSSSSKSPVTIHSHLLLPSFFISAHGIRKIAEWNFLYFPDLHLQIKIKHEKFQGPKYFFQKIFTNKMKSFMREFFLGHFYNITKMHSTEITHSPKGFVLNKSESRSPKKTLKYFMKKHILCIIFPLRKPAS
jgi:hypothetical protein